MNNKNLPKGFTLLELLVSIAIVGILSSIALPQYKAYRARAFDSVALADIRSVALAQESYFIDNQTYYSCQDQGCTELPGIVRISDGVSMEVTVDEDSFTVIGRHQFGSKDYTWDSDFGGIR